MPVDYQMNEDGDMVKMTEFILYRILDKPEEAIVDIYENEEDEIVISLEVDKEDIGKVIGRGGTTAWAIRTLLQSMAMKINRRVQLEIIE
jgi:hypothetical protein